MITCGLDEVGRGPLAGPLVAAGVILNTQCSILNLRDSKKLNSKQRNRVYKQIVNSGAIIAVEEISVRLINTRGIGWANREVFKRLIKIIPADKYIVDGNLKIPEAISVVKADAKYQEVMAASIIAKVWRDKLMNRLHKKYRKYGWESNKGYGTKYHIQALISHGLTPHHRKLFVYTALKPQSITKSGTSR